SDIPVRAASLFPPIADVTSDQEERDSCSAQASRCKSESPTAVASSAAPAPSRPLRRNMVSPNVDSAELIMPTLATPANFPSRALILEATYGCSPAEFPIVVRRGGPTLGASC